METDSTTGRHSTQQLQTLQTQLDNYNIKQPKSSSSSSSSSSSVANTEEHDNNKHLQKATNRIKELERLLNEIKTKNNNNTSTTTNNNNNNVDNNNNHNESRQNHENNNEQQDDDSSSICSVFTSSQEDKLIPSTLSIWNKYIEKIFTSSRHPQDTKYEWHDLTALLLHFMKHDRLQRSVKTLPFNFWGDVKRISNMAYKRYKYVTTQQKKDSKPQDKEPRKVNILILGGSVAMGVMCAENPIVKTSRFSRRNCAWPIRLESLLNSLLGSSDIITVKTITLGGTNTESGITIWDYSLLPADVPYPDIVINAYSTNDMHVLSMEAAAKRNITLENSIFDLSQRFIRNILTPQKTSSSSSSSSSCSSSTKTRRRRPPLLLYYDDYIGNEQKSILQTTSFNRAINILSNYYGIASISYADAVRDMVYGDTDEWWFSPNTWPIRQVHPHMSMHIVSSWVIAYNLLNIVTTYCSSSSSFYYSESSSYQYQPINGLPKLLNTSIIEGCPKPKPIGLPPELTNDLSLDTISQQWRSSNAADEKSTSISSTNNNEKCTNNKDEDDNNDNVNNIPKPCVFSWVSGLERFFEKPKHLIDKMKPYLVNNNGWDATADNKKLGYIPTGGLNSTFTLKLPNVQQPVRSVNLMVMKSYGDKWMNSKIKAEVYKCSSTDKKEIFLNDTFISGIHDKHTSEAYNYKIKLGLDSSNNNNNNNKEGGGSDDGSGGVNINDDLIVKIRLVGGTTFKIMGMAFCDH